MGRRTDRRHQQGDETRARVLDAAVEIAGERGYDGTSMAAIARRAGVSMSSIYWHFENKDDLLAAVIQRSFEQWVTGTVLWTEPPAGVERIDHLASLMADDVVALTRNPDFLRLGLMLSLERRPVEPAARARFLEVRALTLERLRATFRRLLDGAGVEVDPGAVRELADLTMAAADGLFVASQIDPEGVDLDATFRRLVTALVAGAVTSDRSVRRDQSSRPSR